MFTHNKTTESFQVMSLSHVAVGLKVFLHTDDKDVFSGFMGRYIFLKEKSVFGDGKYNYPILLVPEEDPVEG